MSLSTSVKRALLLVYVASSLVWGPRAEAAFHLERVEPDWKPTGYAAIESDRWINEQPLSRPAPRRVIAQPTRLPGGGSLPPHHVMMCESKGSLTARNPSGAAGKWQIMPGTWNGYGGYASADQAPESVQDAKARELWQNGAGASHWRACL